jgi:hypothetical protein
MAIQVCFSLSSEEALKRELAGLREACRFLGLKEGYILSYDEKREFDLDENVTVRVIPACEFILKELS